MSTDNKIIFAIIAATVFLLLLVFFVIILVAYINKRKKGLIAEKKAMQSSYENELFKTQLEIQEQTFQDIGQEIHDNIGQTLSFIKLNINTINIDDSIAAKEKLLESKQLITKVIQDLRDLSKTLSTDFITKIGLPKAIELQLALLERSKIFKTKFIVNGEPKSLSPKKELVIYRVIQESLNNAVKHSEADLIQIEMHYVNNGLMIEVSDNGRGFNYKEIPGDKGLGLNSMKKRIELIRGSFGIESKQDKGTKIMISLDKAT